MSESTAPDAPEAVENAAPEAVSLDPATVVSDFLGIVKSMVVLNLNQANAIATAVKNKRVNVGKVVHDLRNDDATEYAWIKEYQDWKDKADAAIAAKTAEVDAKIKAELVNVSEMTDEEFEVEKVKYKSFKTSVREAMDLASKQTGFDESLFADLPALLSLSTGKETGTGNAGTTGIKRPKLSHITVNGVERFSEKPPKGDGTVERSYTFTNAALFISKDSGVKVSASDLSSVAYEVVGSDNLGDVTSISFTHTVTDKDGVTHSYGIVAIPFSESAKAEDAASEAEVTE